MEVINDLDNKSSDGVVEVKVPWVWVQERMGREKLKTVYNKSPTYETSICKLSKMRKCIHMYNHISSRVWRTIVTCVHPLQVVVLLCTLLYSTV